MKLLKHIIITIRAILGWPFILIGFPFFMIGEFITGRIVTYRANDVKNTLLAEWDANEKAKQFMFAQQNRRGFRKKSNKRK